jgi:hypothetical protein
MTTQIQWLESYRKRQNIDHLARQTAPVKAVAADILRSLKDIENELYWSLSGDSDDSIWPTRLIEQAHELLDHAHAYRQALKDHPAPAPAIEEDTP